MTVLTGVCDVYLTILRSLSAGRAWEYISAAVVSESERTNREHAATVV